MNNLHQTLDRIFEQLCREYPSIDFGSDLNPLISKRAVRAFSKKIATLLISLECGK